MKGYKAFEKGMICRGKQYAENTDFEEDRAVLCGCGMHFCKSPLGVLEYYPLVDDDGNMTEFAEVEAPDDDVIDDGKDKCCTKKLHIGAKVSFAQLVQAEVEFDKETILKNENKNDSAKIGSSGDYAKIGSSGDSAKIGSSGDYAQIGSSGDYAQIGSSGDYAKIGSSGDSAKIGSSGDYAKIGSSGYYAQIGSSGDYAKIGSSGYYAKIGSSGDYAQIGSSGDNAQINSEGEDAVICCAGHGSIVKAKVGSWFTLSEWIYDENKGIIIPNCVKTFYVDGETVKADTWYKLVNCELVEVSK